MNVAELVVNSYNRLSRFRWQLGMLSAALILLSGIGALSIEMEEDISAMLPDRGSTVSRDFELLQQAPFARRAVIHISSNLDSTDKLIEATAKLAEELDPALFGKVSSGPESTLQQRLLPWILEALPVLLTPEELAQLAAELEQNGVKKRLEENYAKLLAPEGWALKKLIRRDPLGLYKHGLDKLRYLNLIPEMRLVKGHFVSSDGNNALLLAEPPVAITDSAGAKKLEEAFRLAADKLPEGVHATLISGHRYTLANAEAIQGDLWLILSASSIAILLLFLIFLRSLRALFVFLIPVAVVCIATLTVALVFPSVSAITVGFGAVLLGITIDFGLHVYFALRHGDSSATRRLRGVVRPVLFGGLTTLAAFTVLLGSDLPGQRQLAVFSITGIGVALVLALWLLPHLVPVGSAPELAVPPRHGQQGRRRWLLAGWLLVMVLGFSQLGNLSFNGDLRSMSLVPEELASAEQQLRGTWGDFRGLAMVWSEGENKEESLALNFRLFEWLREHYPAETPVSIAPLLPPPSVQRTNSDNWQRFWQGTRGKRLLDTLRDEARILGFSDQAFAPFFSALAEPAELQSLATLEAAGLSDIVDALVSDKHGLLTLISDREGLREALARDFNDNLIVVSPSSFREELSSAIDRDFKRFIVSALLAVSALLVVLFRRVRPVCAASVPVVSGLLVMFGVMASFDLPFNLFNVVATILVIGLGIDYGIFMVCRLRDGLDRATDRAVLVSGLTTLAGFGALALARHPALH